MISMNAAALRGLLTDLERTADTDDAHALDFLLLSIDLGRLYCTSTNRHVLAQGWEPLTGQESFEQGSFQPVVIRPEGLGMIKTLLAKPGSAQTAGISQLGTRELSVTTLGTTVTAAAEDSLQFPATRRITTLAADSWSGEPAAFEPTYLASLAMIARRRRASMRLELSDGDRKPAVVTIGDRYQALVMPRRAQRDAEVPPYGWSHLR